MYVCSYNRESMEKNIKIICGLTPRDSPLATVSAVWVGILSVKYVY